MSTIKFIQSGDKLKIDSDAPVQFSRNTPVQVTLSDDTFTSAETLLLLFAPDDGRVHKPAAVPLTRSGSTCTGVIGKAATMLHGIMLVSLGGITSNRTITSVATRIDILQSLDPEQGALGEPATLESEIAAAVENSEQWKLLTARMDTFTSLPDGSTAGDAELQDIRVGVDGTIYNSAGQAVREQMEEVQTDVAGLKANINTKQTIISARLDTTTPRLEIITSDISHYIPFFVSFAAQFNFYTLQPWNVGSTWVKLTPTTIANANESIAVEAIADTVDKIRIRISYTGSGSAICNFIPLISNSLVSFKYTVD